MASGFTQTRLSIISILLLMLPRCSASYFFRCFSSLTFTVVGCQKYVSQGDLDEKVYIQQPSVVVAQREYSMVYRLKKSLYGLNNLLVVRLKDFLVPLVESGLQRCASDHSVSYRHTATGRLS